MVRDEVVIQRGGEPRSHDGYYDGKLGAAREPEQFCPGCTGCGCGYIDYGSTEVTYVNNNEVACFVSVVAQVYTDLNLGMIEQRQVISNMWLLNTLTSMV